MRVQVFWQSTGPIIGIREPAPFNFCHEYDFYEVYIFHFNRGNKTHIYNKTFQYPFLISFIYLLKVRLGRQVAREDDQNRHKTGPTYDSLRRGCSRNKSSQRRF